MGKEKDSETTQITWKDVYNGHVQELEFVLQTSVSET